MPKKVARKKPFSGKKKKEQLKQKRKGRAEAKKKKNSDNNYDNNTNNMKKNNNSKDNEQRGSLKLVTSFGGTSVKNIDNRLATMMIREDDEVVRERRLKGPLPIDTTKQGTIPKAIHKPLKQILFHPRRPKWSSNLSIHEVETNEKIQFDTWCSNIHSNFKPGDITPFEHNLEVWRQLWRVVEQSDIILLTCDCRNPLFHISQSLIDECLLLRKPVVIILTKTDLVPVAHVHNWMKHLKHLYPFVNIFPFSSRGILSENDLNKLKGGVASRRKLLKKKPNLQLSDKAVKTLLILCATICNVDLLNDSEEEEEEEEEDDDDDGNNKNNKNNKKKEGKKKLSIGLCGHPNTGKTSLLNAIVGRKVASVSRTAGHTKHLQHIPLEYPKGVYLIDCPGLIFPLEQPRFIGEVMGLYPIAQIREPFSAIRIVYEYLQLDRLYNVKKPDWYDACDTWSPEMLCEALAEKKGYMLSRGGAPDIQRAGLEIMKDIVDGVVCMRFNPPEFSSFNSTISTTTESNTSIINNNQQFTQQEIDDDIRNDEDMKFLLQ